MQTMRLSYIELRQHGNKWLIAYLELREYRNLIFPVFSDVFDFVTMGADLFSDLQVSIECWIIMNGSYENTWVVLRYFICILRLFMGSTFRCIERSGIHLAMCVWDYILGVSSREW